MTTAAVPAVPPLSPRPEGSSRFRATECGLIVDNVTRLEWYVGPDADITWPNAMRWIDGLHACDKTWTVPSIGQLRSLFDQRFVAGTGYFTRDRYWPAHIDPIFSGIGGGSWVWARGPSRGDQARAFNYNQGIPVWISSTSFYGTVRVFAVRGTQSN
jgi:hypothetical protein